MRASLATIGSLSILGVILLFPMTSAAAAAAALGGVNLTTSPVATSIAAEPGSSATTTLQVQNNEPTAQTINVELETFKAYGTSGAAQMMPFPKGDESASWVHFSEDTFVAQPGAWNSIVMTVNLPKGAGLGYYYAVVFKPQLATTDQQVVGSSIRGGNAVLVLVNAISANEQPQIAVSNFSADKKLYEYLPATFSVTIKNTGNIFLAPTGDIYISKSSSFTNSIDTIPVNESEGNVLAGTSRVFTQQWNNGFPLFVPKTVDGEKITNKKGQLEQTLQWNFANANKFRFGKYYARLVMVYSNGSRDIPIEATISFWVIPWKILSVVLLIVIILCIGLFGIGRKFASRTARLSKKVKDRKQKDA
jgi:hypothetical protein